MPQLIDEGPSLAAHAGNPVVGSATGSGHAFCTLGSPDGGCTTIDHLRTFSFNAILRADGSVRGRAQAHEQTGGGAGDILCLRFLENEAGSLNRAAVIGVNTHATGAPGGTGELFFLAVEDNGQGNSVPDRITNAFPEAFIPIPLIALVCNETDDGLAFWNGLIAEILFDTEHGNIQVRAPNE